METNGNNGEERKRGLEAVLDTQKRNGNGQDGRSEEVKAAEAIPSIIRILSGLPDRQVGIVFEAVQAIKRTAAGESLEEIRHGFRQLDRQRMAREHENRKKGWFRRG